MTSGYSGVRPYDTWHVGPARVGDLLLMVASKPGVFMHGALDAAAGMLAEAIAAGPPAPSGAQALHLGSGNGLVPAAAQAMGFEPLAFDRYVGNVHATRRTLEASATGSITVPAMAGTVFHAVLANPVVAEESCALATIRIAPDKLGVQQAVAEAFRALAIGGTCLLAGANDEGARSAARLLEQVFGHVHLEAQHSGCRLLRATRRSKTPGDATIFASPWLDAERFHEVPVSLDGHAFTLATRPGVFSWEHLDEATGILAGLMRVDRGESVLDLGCGAGALGVVAAMQSRTGPVVLLDADADAVRCAARTAARAGVDNVTVGASDVASAVGENAAAALPTRFDVVVSNPPFHLGKGTELAIPRAFIEQAHAHLAPGGRLYLVANRTLPYERLIAECFGEVRTAHDGRRFKVIGGVRRG